MSIRTFWLIFLKVIGIFLLYGSLSVVPSLATIPMMISFGAGVETSFVPAVLILVSGVVYGLVVFLFIFRAGFVLRLLRLDLFPKQHFTIFRCQKTDQPWAA